jgi:hypothetical protein
MNLRQFPVCYLCGGQWRLFQPIGSRNRGRINRVTTWREWEVVVQCDKCMVVVDAVADVGVVHSREWLSHDRINRAMRETKR